ncbi:MAG: nucleotide exchange factor GrpE [Actinobacteria bacterium]|nr:nucleotide exchange factor GrpE [Actinomycetota bacterium]
MSKKPVDIEQPAAPEAEASVDASAEAVVHDLEVVEHDVEELLSRLSDAEARRDEYLGDLQRVAADFDNYRKRVLREQEQLSARVAARLAQKLLPVLDDLDRALEAADQHEEAKVADGVRLTRATLWTVLAGEGIAEIEAEGAFDPHVHEALMAQPAEDAEPGSIVQVLQKGYRLGDAVVRPARVIVAE